MTVDTGDQTNDTRERLLDAAERLFVAKGFDATSVRDITAAAGCNVAAVNYHFGGKGRLYRETFRRLLGQLRDRRIAAIEGALEAAGDRADLELFLRAFAEAFVEPLLEDGRGARLMHFLDREMHNPHLPPETFFGELIRPMMEFHTQALERVVGPVEPMTARMCLMSLVGQLIHILKAHHMFGSVEELGMAPPDLRDHIRHFVRFSAAGVRACVGAGPAPPGEVST